jgi:uncharacterized protein YjdB
MRTSLRAVAATIAAFAGFACADQTVSGVRAGGAAQLALAPMFSQAPEGGPTIDIARIRGVLKSGTDSAVTDADIRGDSAIMEFARVRVRGDSTKYLLEVVAFDANDVKVFKALQEIQVKPGDNVPASPVLDYIAPDAIADEIDIVATTVALDWAGAAVGDVSCLNRAPSSSAVTQQLLSVTGTSGDNTSVPDVRVGWTSRDTSVVTVDANGLVRARCSNKKVWVVARTFLDRADSIEITVTAPPFSLLMDPDSINLARGSAQQLTALVVDENGNTLPASQVNWSSSDPLRATVTPAGLVQALTNGRVQITASSGNRTTIGIVNVVRPIATKVQIIPATDTVLVGQTRSFFAKAADASGKVIGDATGFDWFTSNGAIASVDFKTGLVTAKAIGTAFIYAKIDGKKDSALFNVAAARPPGSIQSIVMDAAADRPLGGATISGPSTSATSATDGSFTLAGLNGGDDIVIARTGYVSVTSYDTPVFANQTIQIPDIPLAPANGSPGSLSGRVVNALTAGGVGNLIVKAYAGLNAGPSPKRPNATATVSAMTASDGSYSLGNVPAGAYTLIVSGAGYSEAVTIGFVLGGQARTQSDIRLAPESAGSGLVVLLSWGSCGAAGVSCDLDARMTGPAVAPDTGRFHISSGVRSYLINGDSIASVDVPDVTGPGPEVVGLRPASAPGLYRFYVHDVSNAANSQSLALSDQSAARVDVYQNNRLVATFFPPRGQPGTLWHVFEFDGGRLRPVQQITFQSDVTTLP